MNYADMKVFLPLILLLLVGCASQNDEVENLRKRVNNLEKRLNEKQTDVNKQCMIKTCHRVKGDQNELLQQTMTSNLPKMVLFLGSNLVNYDDVTGKQFLQCVADGMQSGDVLLLGLDIVKDPKRILDAYNDATGITKAFNMNLLERMNRELDANFDIEKFDHAPVYENNQAVSYIVSKEDQTIHFAATEESITFRKGEKILTEISRKYTTESLRNLLPDDVQIEQEFQDSNKDFSDYLLRKIN